MRFVTLADPQLWFAFDAGLLSFGLVLLLAFTLAVLRLRLLLASRRRRRFLNRWRPLIMRHLVGLSVDFPPMMPADWHTFFAYWNYLHESLRGDAKGRLNQVARAVGADREARRMLRSRGVRDRLMATLTLGNLREPSAWKELDSFVTSDNSFLALTAMRALVQIDSKAAIPILLSQLNRRKHWSLTKIARMLREAGEEAFVEPLLEAASLAPRESASRLIHLLTALHCTAALPDIRQLLATTTDAGIIVDCLTMMSAESDRPLVRRHLAHDSGTVRAQAALALGRIGIPGDEIPLVALLDDPDWWVRYRAAQALAELPFLERHALELLQADLRDPDSRNIVGQVLAERDAA
ncbi:HEAT repeat domain-containing protein [bacterium]|nr:HEAT repeat domain-containing protein [bacterium]